MANPIVSRIRSAWNAFRSAEDEWDEVGPQTPSSWGQSGVRSSYRYSTERTMVTSVYTRIAIDVSGYEIKHVQLDDRGRYKQDVDSKMNMCFDFEPNLDQGPRAFKQNIASVLCGNGVSGGAAAIVPVDTTADPSENAAFDIYTMRVADIIQWFPHHVRVSLWNEDLGQPQEITLEKSTTAIVENPLYNVMNAPNSTLQRLIRKLNLLDNVDDASAGRLDMIIQLPYVIKSEAKRVQAEKRRQEIEVQLKGSQYGIAYADGTEKITQLNRPAENQLLKQVEYLRAQLYSELGLTEAVMNGTADEQVMRNYYSRTIEPIVDAITQAIQRAFVGRSGYEKKQRIQAFLNPFKFIPDSELAKILDVVSRNEILSPNEVRGFLGIPPSDDPKADKLINSNMPLNGNFENPTDPPDPVA